MNPGLKRFSGTRVQKSPTGTSGGFTRAERDRVVTTDPRERVHTDYARDQYERSHPDALLEAVSPDDLFPFTKGPENPGLRRGLTDPNDLPRWLPPAQTGEPSPEFEERVRQLQRKFDEEGGRRLNEERRQREYEERWRPRRWNDFVEYPQPYRSPDPIIVDRDAIGRRGPYDLLSATGSSNPGLSRFSVEEMAEEPLTRPVGEDPSDSDETVTRSRRRAISDAGRRHQQGIWSMEELREREEQIARSRARRGPDAPPTREETRQDRRLLRLQQASKLFGTPWSEHTDVDTGVKTYTNSDRNGVTHGISVPMGDEGHYVHETLVTPPQHFRALNEALLNAMMLEQYLQSQNDQKNQTQQQHMGPLIRG